MKELTIQEMEIINVGYSWRSTADGMTEGAETGATVGVFLGLLGGEIGTAVRAIGRFIVGGLGII